MTSKTGKIGIGLALVALMATSACVTDPETGQRKVSKAAIGGVGGALGGYLLGDLVGGKRDRTEKIVGAGIGALAGAGVGAYMDAQEKKLREQTAGTGVDVIRDGNDLLLRMPSGITFGFDSAEVQPQFQPTLNEVASTLSQFPKTYIDIYGHTDSDGSDAYNQGLSERRAQSVANYLAMRGVQSARMATRGFGETQPIASNTTAEGKAANRRVEIKIVPVTENDVRS
ncbi:OmpA family lipoprotein [Sphingobium jiangsuense]|uniref:Outer membrane protein OmpA-like peptidoglycan-associated protein n=1 Tax=Sphingobium jiangsuense TaxID=870476 RepID=A0A7W6BIS2_9SPHN|nr:OmpA family protein [Sphingobium jiangsuense]MBB3924460.1 outer membrane protein OmpA-like peptidoglycan-associated protein [Sphingobium jiangsuense]GLT02337.1 OmpA family lipoprotein [Sphingobium jiangsuense]